MSVCAVVVAAGSGTRLGADVPKAFVEIGARSLLSRCIESFLAHPEVDRVVAVVPADRIGSLEVGTSVDIVAGGADRSASVRNGLEVLPGECDVVLVHDAARPFVPADVLTRVIAAVRGGADGVIPVMPVTDTIKRVDTSGRVVATVPRDELRAVQTPQGFSRRVLDRAHQQGGTATDDAGLIEEIGGTVVTVDGAAEGFKITTPFDLAVATALFATETTVR